MTINDLQNNQIVTYRLGRAGRSKVEWEDWQTGPIYVRRREIPYKKHPAGELLTLVPIIEDAWAEYGLGDYMGGNTFLCEDYYMEIKDLNQF